MIREKREVLKCSVDGDILNEYESVNIAAKENNISACSISNVLRKKQKSAAGYLWKYKDITKHIREPKMPAIFTDDIFLK